MMNICGQRSCPGRQRVEPLLSALKKDSTFSLAWADLASAYSKIPWGNQSEKPYYVRKSLGCSPYCCCLWSEKI